jgi:hypothetical protein
LKRIQSRGYKEWRVWKEMEVGKKKKKGGIEGSRRKQKMNE